MPPANCFVNTSELCSSHSQEESNTETCLLHSSAPLSSHNSCGSCDKVCCLLLSTLQNNIHRIQQGRLLKFSFDPADLKIDISQSQGPLDVIVGDINTSAVRQVVNLDSVQRELRACITRIHLEKGDICPLQQNGMDVIHDISNGDDSGFCSSGPYFRDYPCTQSNTGKDLNALERNNCELQQSGFYFGAMDSTKARHILKTARLGTFLIRDSSDPRYLYSLSVKTERGATSVRIAYDDGLFQFDSDDRVRQRLPKFDSIMSLVDFHMMLSQDGKSKKWKWEDNLGKKTMNVVLSKPMRSGVTSLSHLARVKINQNLENVHLPSLSVDRLPMLPTKLKDYLKDYPYRV